MELQEQERAEQIVQETPAEERYQAPADTSFGTKPVTGAHVQIRDQADARKRNRRLMGISMVWIITLGALIVAALLAFSFRQLVVERYPAAASIYQAFGVKVTSKGLDFENPKTRNVVINGEPTLVVNGYVRNHSGETRDVPMIELSLMSNDGEKLASWAVEPPQPSLEAGARLEYVSEYPNPPLEAGSLKYRFYEDGEPSELNSDSASESETEPASEDEE